MDLLFFIMGLMGAGLVLAMYWMLEQDRISSNSFVYYALNGAGAALVFASILHDFDLGDMGGVVVEGAWVVISVLGLIKTARRKGVGNV